MFNSIRNLLLCSLLVLPIITKADPYAIHFTSQVNPILNHVNSDNLRNNLVWLTHYPNRSANTDTGREASLWIFQQMKNLIAENLRTDVSIETFDAPDPSNLTYSNGLWIPKSPSNFKQPSIIMKIGASTEPGIVIGAHMDTVYNPEDPTQLYPGADDDGTGTVAVMEIARVLLASHLQFKKPIYLIWYAAEEWGELGSQAVVKDFVQRKIPIEAVLQLDQIGYAANNEDTVWVFQKDENITHYDESLSDFLKSLVHTYLHKNAEFTHGGDSDDLEWAWAGFKTARVAESDYKTSFYPYAHDSDDTMDKISFPHLTDYVKLSLAFAIELAEPN